MKDYFFIGISDSKWLFHLDYMDVCPHIVRYILLCIDFRLGHAAFLVHSSTELFTFASWICRSHLLKGKHGETNIGKSWTYSAKNIHIHAYKRLLRYVYASEPICTWKRGRCVHTCVFGHQLWTSFFLYKHLFKFYFYFLGNLWRLLWKEIYVKKWIINIIINAL